MPVTIFPPVASSGISNLTDGHIFVGNAAGKAVDVAMTGDITISDTGVTAIGTGKVTSAMIVDGTIANVDVADAAAILRSKLATGSANTVPYNNATGVMLDASLTANCAIVSNSAGLLSVATWTTFSPTVTLVGGSGNTVPGYTNNVGRYLKMGKIVFVSVDLNGNTGSAGAGTGQYNIALPVTAGASADSSTMYVPIGMFFNNTTDGYLFGQILASGTTIQLHKFNTSTSALNFTGADQNNATRFVRLRFFYEVD
jgi:hypothetical protein